MRKTVLFITLSIIVSNSIFSQSKKKKDREAIKEMSGCFEVTFNFTETFNYSKAPNYKPSKTKNDKALEWAELIINEKTKISIPHLLQVGNYQKLYSVDQWR